MAQHRQNCWVSNLERYHHNSALLQRQQPNDSRQRPIHKYLVDFALNRNQCHATDIDQPTLKTPPIYTSRQNTEIYTAGKGTYNLHRPITSQVSLHHIPVPTIHLCRGGMIIAPKGSILPSQSNHHTYLSSLKSQIITGPDNPNQWLDPSQPSSNCITGGW